MIVRSLNVQGLGCFADRIEVGPFGPGLNIVFGPNGAGKSTLSRAITTAFLDGHRVKAAEMKALRSWGRRLTPQIGADFEHGKRVYRIEKQFLESASSNLFRHEGGAWRSFMTGDDADTFIREILRCTPPAAGMAQRDKHWGIAQILWATQGSSELPALASSVIESVQRSVGAQLSAGGTALEQRILEKYSEFYTPGRGQLRRSAEAVTLAEARERLIKERTSIEEALAEFETECGRVEDLRVKLAETETKSRNLGDELRNTRLAAQLYAGLSAERAERLQKVKTAESDYARISEAIAAAGRNRDRLRIDGSMLTDVERDIPVNRVTVMAEEQTVAELETAFRDAQDYERAATERLRVANLAREYVSAHQNAKALNDKLSTISARTAEVQDLERQRLAIVAPSEAELRRFRATAESHRDAVRRLELARIKVTVDPVADVLIEIAEGETPGRTDLCPGVQADFAGSPNLTLTIPGFGTMRVRGPVSDYASVRRDQDESAAELARILERFGTSDEKGLEQLSSAALGIEAQVREARSACAALAGNSTTEAIRHETTRINERVAEILRDQPEWAAATPDAGALQAAADTDSRNAQSARADTCAKLMKAQHSLKDAHGVLQALILKQQTLTDSIAVCQKELDFLCRDVTDEQRQSALYNSAMDRMAQQEALQQNEKNLEAYPVDPAGSILRLEPALEAAILEVQLSRDELRDTERRVSQLSERAPYSRFAEICERLETVESDCRREDTRMAAVALLRSALLERKSSLLQAVALPVEERATSYLARICGKPLASIRMTRDFAAHDVVPAELQTSQETVQVERLSGGEKEQIHLCTRLALAEELMRDEAHFLLLDDVLTATDSNRLQKVCEMMTEFAKKMQIILFTCHPERFADIQDATLINVEALRLHPGLAGSRS